MIHCGDCIEIMTGLEPDSVDLCVADVPYGQTQNAWDVPIPFEPMWRELRRVCKPNAAIILMAAQPFASKLICSNLQDFRYDLIWKKNKPTGFLNAKKQPLRIHEHILVFYRKPPVYEPQMTKGHAPGNYARRTKHSTNYGAQTPTEYGGSTERYPTSVIEIPIINNDDPDKRHHGHCCPARGSTVHLHRERAVLRRNDRAPCRCRARTDAASDGGAMNSAKD